MFMKNDPKVTPPNGTVRDSDLFLNHFVFLEISFNKCHINDFETI